MCLFKEEAFKLITKLNICGNLKIGYIDGKTGVLTKIKSEKTDRTVEKTVHK